MSIRLMLSGSGVTNMSRAYANVFRFNREKKRFERAKVNSRCFHWFPAAMLESLSWEGLQHGFSILNTIIFSDTLFRITRVRKLVHPRNFSTLFIYCPSTMFQFLDSIYWIVYCVWIKLTYVTWKPPISWIWASLRTQTYFRRSLVPQPEIRLRSQARFAPTKRTVYATFAFWKE